MEIEEGPQMNCSELVARLYPIDDRDELIDTVKSIEDITGWKAGVRIRVKGNQSHSIVPYQVKSILEGGSGNDFSLLIPVDLSLVKISSDDGKGKLITINEDDLLRSNDSLNKDILNAQRWDHSEHRIAFIPVTKINTQENYPSPLYIRTDDGYCNDKSWKLLSSGHSYSPHFPFLSSVIRSLSKKGLPVDYMAHDGGSPLPFEKWCRNNGFSSIIK